MQSSLATTMTPTTAANPKAYKCEICNTTYSDRTYFELHKQGHQKDLPVVQIVNLNANQIIPQPAHQPQQIQCQSQQQPQMQQPQFQATPIIIPEDQLENYKRMYGADSQIIAITPITQYQVINANNRGNTTTMTQAQPGQIFQSYTPTYVLAGNDGSQNLHSIFDQSIELPSQMQPQTVQTSQQVQSPQTQQIHQQQSTIQGPAPQQQQQQHHQQQANVSTTFVPRPSRTVITSIKHRPYKCDQCTASFIEQNELDEHRKKHTGDGPFTCEDCHFTFMYKSHFRSHKTRCQKKRAMMPQSEKPIPMNQTPIKREFPTNQMVNHSIKQTNNMSAHQLASIGKTGAISSRANMSKHMLAKLNKSQAKFNPNNPSFKRMKREKRVDRPFECDDCDASFQTDNDLRTHKKKHTGEGPFKCEECRFVFLYRKLYEAHRRRCEKKRKETLQPNPVNTSTAISTQSTSVITELPQPITTASHGQEIQHHTPQNSIHIDQHPNNISSETPTFASVSMHSNIDQGSMIEMRTVDQHGEIQHIQVPHNAVIEQVIVNSDVTDSVNGGRQDIKYDLIPVSVPAVGGDCVNVNQIMNLIKSKEHNH